jgi:hypothetical protein
MTSQSGFQPSCVVTDPRELFGHNRPRALLDSLLTHIGTGTNAQILGEHRSGKTSVIKCSMARLWQEKPALVQVYLNFREHYHITGRANAIRYMLANIHAAVAEQNVFPADSLVRVRHLDLSCSPMFEDHYEALTSVQDYTVDGLLRDYLLNTLPRHEVGVVLYLDEYEHMLLKTMEAQVGAFFLLRNLSSEPAAVQRGPKPLTIIIAGATPWDKLCSDLGSPELNNIGPVSYVQPLGLQPFEEMWQHCLNLSSEDIAEVISTTGIRPKDVYAMTGGWPFYVKVVGEHLSTGGADERIIYESLYQHFNILWSRLTTPERKVLKSQSQDAAQSLTINDLIRRGLLDMHEDGVRPRGRLWMRFVSEQVDDTSSATPSQPQLFGQQKEQLRILVEEIGTFVYEINQSTQLSARQEVFVTTNQSWRIHQDLKRLALSEQLFSQFAQAAYKLIFESTTAVREERARTLERLPKDFRRSRRIVRVIDSIRHNFGAHMTDHPDWDRSKAAMPIEEVFSYYLGSTSHPRDDQFVRLQFAIVSDLIDFLRELHRNMSTV